MEESYEYCVGNRVAIDCAVLSGYGWGGASLMKRRKPRPSGTSGAGYLLAGGTMLALVGILVDMQGMVQPAQPSNVCQTIVQPQATLSREELSRLLSIPERDRKDTVRTILNQPYCQLPKVEIRAGFPAEREAYPLEFDPHTWLVVLYEGEEYAGYSFVFQRN